MPKSSAAAEPTVTFWGAARTVTGSMHQLDRERQDRPARLRPVPGQAEPRASSGNRDFPFRAKDIDAVILSHAHIDHCGNLPNLVQPRASPGRSTAPPPPATSRPSCSATPRRSRRRTRTTSTASAAKGEPKVEPLYDGRDVFRTLTAPAGGAVRRPRRASARGWRRRSSTPGTCSAPRWCSVRIDGPAGERTADVHRRPRPAGAAHPPRPGAGAAVRPAHQREHLRRAHARAGGRDRRPAGRGGAAHRRARRQASSSRRSRRPHADGRVLPAPAHHRREAAGHPDLRGQPDGDPRDRGVP